MTIIKKEMIFLDSDLKTRDEIICFLANQAFQLGLVKDEKTYAKAVFEREKEMPTAIGYDLAIPHGKSKTIETPFVLFLRLKEKIEWTDHNNEVKMVFILGIPSEGAEKTHLKILSQISRKLMHDNFRQELMNENNRDEIYRLLNEIDL